MNRKMMEQAIEKCYLRRRGRVMVACRQCKETCQIYKEYWCRACRKKSYCRIRKNMTKEHKIENGCEFECTDIDICTNKEVKE